MTIDNGSRVHFGAREWGILVGIALVISAAPRILTFAGFTPNDIKQDAERLARIEASIVSMRTEAKAEREAIRESIASVTTNVERIDTEQRTRASAVYLIESMERRLALVERQMDEMHEDIRYLKAKHEKG